MCDLHILCYLLLRTICNTDKQSAQRHVYIAHPLLLAAQNYNLHNAMCIVHKFLLAAQIYMQHTSNLHNTMCVLQSFYTYVANVTTQILHIAISVLITSVNFATCCPDLDSTLRNNIHGIR